MDKIDNLIRDLHYGKDGSRAKTAGELAKINDPRAVYALLNAYMVFTGADRTANNRNGNTGAMSSPRGAVYIASIFEVADKINGKKYLVQALNDTIYRDAAESILIHMGEDGIDTLITELENPSNVRMALYILNRLHNRGEKVIDHLLFIIGKPGYNNSALSFLFALINDDILKNAEYNSLLKALGHPTAGNKVTEYLGAYDTQLINPLISLLNPTLSYWSGNVSGIAYQNVIRCIKLRGTAAITPLIESIGKGDVYVQVAEILTDIGQPALPYLVNVLQENPDKQSRGMAAKIMGDIRDKTCTGNLISALISDEEGSVRTHAIISLGKIGDAAAVNFLIQSLGDDEVHSTAVGTLGQTPAFNRSLQKFNDVLPDLVCIKCFCRFEKGKISYGSGKNLVCPVCRKCKIPAHFNENVHGISLELNNRFPACVYTKEGLSYTHVLKLHNGQAVSGLYELCTGLRTLSEKDYRKHITRTGNEIAVWVRDILGNPSLSDQLAKCMTRIAAAAQIEKFLGLWRYETGPKNLFVHWFWYKELIDFSEIKIFNANEYEIEEFIIRARNDGDKFRQKRYKDIEVHVSTACKFPKAKMNLLNDTFKKVVLTQSLEV